VDRRKQLGDACRAGGVEAAYLFGSRLEDGLRALNGVEVSGEGSDVDVGVYFGGRFAAERLADLQVALEEVLEPLRVDLVPLDRVDALFQFRAIDGHRVFEADSSRADLFELAVMRRAAELLPIQRRIERERFGVATS
jgi:predicted nucleotidyltransferase